MKKGYYIHFEGRGSVGVSKKIDAQMEEFKKHFDMQEMEVEIIPRTLAERVLGLFPTASIKRDYEGVLQRIKEPDFFYIRRTVADKAYLEFFKELKKRYPNCRIIVELYVYPYDRDNFGKWNAWPFYFKEIIYRRNLKKYVDRFVTYTPDKEIFGIPTICTTNGVNVEGIARINGKYHANKIIMLGVAYMQRQHGYERIIEGMKIYYNQTGNFYDVYLYLVGDGPEKKKYRELVEKYNLQEYVKFFPTTTGKDLDDLYDEGDIALAAFGMYKVGYHEAIGALKTRECLAKGIPMISGSPIDILDDRHPYAKIFPNDSSTVNIEEVIKFYKQIQRLGKNKNEVADVLREYAAEHADIAVVMRPIVDFFKKE